MKEFCRGYKTALRPNRRVKKNHGGRLGWRETWDQGNLQTSEQIEALDRQERQLRQVVTDMTNCEQTKGQSVLEHGQAVHQCLQVLLRGLRSDSPGESLRDFRLPRGLYDKRGLLLERVFDDYTLEKYTIFHDCGKPYCLRTDEEGKRHFLNHAEVSYKTWMRKCGGDEQVGRLIRMDMDIHCLKAKDVPEFAARPEAATLLLTGIAEIHANAKMFGGMDSDSFKMKFKQLDRRCRAICKAIEDIDEVFGNGKKESSKESVTEKSDQNGDS